jgi:hypothetical protein
LTRLTTCYFCELKDAVPKKRGPKTDVLEALLKRVDGLEKQLHNEKNPPSQDEIKEIADLSAEAQSAANGNLSNPQQHETPENSAPQDIAGSTIISPTEPRCVMAFVTFT